MGSFTEDSPSNKFMGINRSITVAIEKVDEVEATIFNKAVMAISVAIGLIQKIGF